MQGFYLGLCTINSFIFNNNNVGSSCTRLQQSYVELNICCSEERLSESLTSLRGEAPRAKLEDEENYKKIKRAILWRCIQKAECGVMTVTGGE